MPEPTKPEGNLFHAILKHLYYNYPLDDKKVEVNHFLINELGIGKNDIAQSIKIKDVLNHLKDKGFITWSSRAEVYGVFTFGEPAPVKPYPSHVRIDTMTLEFHHVYVTLTLDGYNYYSEVERNSELHQSIIKTNEKTVKMSRYTLFVAAAAIIVALLPFFKKEKDTVLTVPQPLKLDTVTTRPVQSPKENRGLLPDSPRTTSKNVSKGKASD